jgi:hypothetical protein
MKKTFNKQAWLFFWQRQKQFILVIGSLVFIYLIFFITITGYLGKQINELNNRDRQLSRDLEAIAKAYEQRGQIDEKLIEGSTKINAFLPDKFELFRIINNLEAISQRTKYGIFAYRLTVPDSDSTTALKTIHLALQGRGSKSQFLEFLKNYQFVTGQMLTIQTVSLSAKSNVESTLSIELYSYNPKIVLDNLPNIVQIDEKDKKYLEAISRYTKEDALEKLKMEYQTKDNPFQK